VPDYYTVAKNITTRTPARSRILAPEHISGWVTTLRGHPYPEIARTTYINALSPYLELKDLNARINLLRFISGERGFGKMLPVVIETLKERKILTVAFHSSLPWRHSFASELDRLGFKGQTVNKHEVWVKEPCSD
jgi:hypothetical protein